MMTRRHAIKATATAAGCFAATLKAFSVQAGGVLLGRANPANQVLAGASHDPFSLPPLPYAFDALEPYIDAQTMEIHHGKHHAAYVANLNKAVSEVPELGLKSIEELLRNLDAVPEKVRVAIRNHGGGHYNHSLFWQMMKKDGGGEPKGELAAAIDRHFGSFSSFKDRFAETAVKVFGSGWAWLALGPGGKLTVEPTPNQDTPLSMGRQPLLGLDVWEHAYYLKYQNRRADYISAWFNVVNWDFVTERYASLKS